VPCAGAAAQYASTGLPAPSRPGGIYRVPAGQSLATAGLPCDCAKTGAAVTGATIIASAITPYNFLVISMPLQGLWERLAHSASLIIRAKLLRAAIC
jgi:hypothetical protein